ncbi:HlyD family type I secretion periplasmic adaptor subunit [Palleronia abyssalis]|uniref:Membrane fusion protein (MFP) family protein n=1 Tax=Palleronia abyssalis TaxID=1501240 RepID=A0A2R8BZB7_9RHOB|nr:HlyD family type I secretion periplasmic adaptor subunit [Palleronia abyssalis]SPJ25492.1 Type I secretion system membrane fusion protein PrsE [Palleronia abyssalis]
MAKNMSTRPIMILGFTIIFLTFGGIGGWATVAKIDSAVVAPGSIALDGNRKVIQHFEGGIVEDILVDEADTVEQGQVLLRLSDVESRSNLGVLSNRIAVAEIVEARLLAERDMHDAITYPEAYVGEDLRPDLAAIVADQNGLFEDRRSILRSQVDILNSRVGQTREQIQGLTQQKTALEKRTANFTEMLERMRGGNERGLVETNLLSQREDELIQIEANLGKVISEIAQAKNVISETEMQALQVEQEYRERASNELETVRAELTELLEREKVARDVLQRTEIRSPGDGSIQNLKVHTVGSVVRPGDDLMELVPENEKLVINAKVSPTDIDNISPGLSTEIRLAAFKARLMPMILGEVASVSNDVITPESPDEQPYYLARIAVEEVDIPDELAGRLVAGMPADVVIITGERRVVDYFTSPLLDAVRKSLIEE